MNIVSHRISGKAFHAMAAGGGGAAAIAELRAAQHSKNRMLARGVVETAFAAGHPRAELAARAFGVLADVEESAPRAVADVLGYPAVGAWAARSVRGLADPGRLSAVALAAAVRAARPCELPVLFTGGEAALPSLGVLRAPVGDAVRTVRCDDRALIEIDGETVDPGRPGERWQPLGRITADGYTVTLDDLDPYRWPEAGVPTPRLTAEERRRWESTLRDAWGMLAAGHWTLREEIAAAVTVLTPIGAPCLVPQSESARDAFGSIALSEPPDGAALAETLAHETQHLKLYALNDIVPLAVTGTGNRYYAPWRPDPRPALSLLNGAYAYLGVAGFWRRQRFAEGGAQAFRARVQFARWREAAHGATRALLAGDGLSPEGVEFVTGMAGTLERWLPEQVELAAVAQAHRESAAHYAAWTARNT